MRLRLSRLRLKQIQVLETKHMITFQMPLIRTMFDSIPILPKITIKNDKIEIICLKRH